MNPAVTEAVTAWLRAFDLPQGTPGLKDLDGRRIPMPKFDDDATCRYFFPRRTLSFQQRMAKHLAGQLRKRGARVDIVPLSITVYETWLAANRLQDSPAERFRFATLLPY